MKRARVSLQEGLSLVSVLSACGIAVLVNVLADRHPKRWDVTRDARYTLSPATLETLHNLPDPVHLWVLLPASDPLLPSVRALLVSYASEGKNLEVHYVDPDRDAVQTADLRRRFGMDIGRSEEGGNKDAVLVASRGERHWFVTEADLFETSDADAARAKPKEERAITGAIRHVVAGEKARLCFVAGHGEFGPEPSQSTFIGNLRTILERDNYELVSTDLKGEEPKHCSVVVLGGPRTPLSQGEDEKLERAYLQGTRLLLALGPVYADSTTGLVAPGLGRTLAAVGVHAVEAVVHDTEPHVLIAGTHGEGFFSQVRPHRITTSLLDAPGRRSPQVAIFMSRPLLPDPSASVTPLLVTTDSAYAKVNIQKAIEWTDLAPRTAEDQKGPFVLAAASERSLEGGKSTRAVVLGTSALLSKETFDAALTPRGGAILVEHALSWLAARPEILDIPDKPTVVAGLRLSEESRREIRTYVLVYVPLASLLLALAVLFRRRSTEGAPYERRS